MAASRLHDTFEDLDAEIVAAEAIAHDLKDMFKGLRFEPTTRFGIALIRLGCQICVANGVSAAAVVQPLLAQLTMPKGQKVM